MMSVMSAKTEASRPRPGPRT